MTDMAMMNVRWTMTLVLLAGTMTVSASPPVGGKLKSQPKPPGMPVVVILSGGEHIKGIVQSFNNGTYTIWAEGQTRQYDGSQMKAIVFESEQADDSAARRERESMDPKIAGLIEQLDLAAKEYKRTRKQIPPKPVRALAAKGVDAIKPLMAELKTNRLTIYYAEMVLAEIGPDALPVLLEVYRSADHHAVRSVCQSRFSKG